MNNLFYKPIALFLLLFYMIKPSPDQLKIKIYNLKEPKGDVIIYLYNKDGTIPDKNFSKYYKKKIVSVTENTVSVDFKDLPAGRYAVMIIHDENKNGYLDKTFMRPKEGFGLSNFEKINLFNKPDFQKASFELKKDTLIRIKTIYF